MTLGFVLLELKQMVGEIDVLIGKILDIAEAEATIEAEDEGTTDFGILLWVVIGDELLHLLLREHVFTENLIIDLDGDADARILLHVLMFDSVVDDLFETLEAGLSSFAFGVLLKIFGERNHHVFIELLGADDSGITLIDRALGEEILEAVERHIEHSDVFLVIFIDILLEVFQEVDDLLFLFDAIAFGVFE